MDATTLPFVMSICILGNIALIPLIVSAGLIGVMRKIADWIELRWP